MQKPFTLLRCLALAALMLTAGASAQAPGDVRVVLVIGNSAYAHAPALPNPVNDARAMGQTLRGLGFTVVEVRDGSKARMAEAITQVRDALQGRQGIGMLYYAGHGLQVDARNYMVPVDARMAKAADVAQQTVEVGSVIEAFKAAGNRMNILVLDACRDNPFGGITTGKGLAPLDAPSGTFLAYATAPGNVAEDGDVKSGNGLYTQFLLQELKKPQARIEDVFKRVRFAVRQASGGRQIPWESTSLEEDFQFNDGRLIAPPPPTAQSLEAEFTREKPDWDRIKSSSNPDDFYAFLQKYPSGTISEAAHARLNELAAAALPVQGAGPDGTSQPYALAKFRTGDVFETSSTSTGASGVVRRIQTVTRIEGTEVLLDSRAQMPGKAAMGSAQTFVDNTQGGWIGIKDALRNNPPRYLTPGGLLQIGARWKSGAQAETWEGRSMGVPPSTVTRKIVAREKITVPAGSFDAFRIETENLFQSGPITATRCQFWLAPDIPLPVKSSCRNEGTQPSGSTSEMTRFVRGA